jgi:hypothetical protein
LGTQHSAFSNQHSARDPFLGENAAKDRRSQAFALINDIQWLSADC